MVITKALESVGYGIHRSLGWALVKDFRNRHDVDEYVEVVVLSDVVGDTLAVAAVGKDCS